MKLTNAMRNCFIDAVMKDVPRIDYDEKIQSAAEKIAIPKLPLEIQKIWGKSSLKGFIKTETVSVSYKRNYFYVAVPFYADYNTMQSDLSESAEIKSLYDLSSEQSSSIFELRRKTKAAIYSVTTLKQALELMPEFESYLPKPNDAPTKYAPAVIANLAADLTKAGWPKGKAK